MTPEVPKYANIALNVNHECSFATITSPATPPSTTITYRNLDPLMTIDLSTYFNLTGGMSGASCYNYKLIDNPILSPGV